MCSDEATGTAELGGGSSQPELFSTPADPQALSLAVDALKCIKTFVSQFIVFNYLIKQLLSWTNMY